MDCDHHVTDREFDECVVRLARMEEKLDFFIEQQKRMVTHDEFAPVKAVVYGISGLAASGVVGGIMKLIFWS